MSDLFWSLVIFFSLIFGAAAFFHVLGLTPVKCPKCGRRRARETTVEEQPGYGVLTTYSCTACGNSFKRFAKV